MDPRRMACMVRAKRKVVGTLQELCYNTIVRDFDRISQFSPEVGVRFLQSKSQQLLNNFKVADDDDDEHCVSLEHVLFAINPYLREANLNCFEWFCFPPIINKLKSVECNLSVLDVPALPKDLLWELIRLLPSCLESLSITRSGYCSNQMLRTVYQNCPHLKKLDVERCTNITDDGILALCQNGENKDILPNFNLQSLNLDCTNISKECVTVILNNCPNLTELVYSHLCEILCELHNEDIQSHRSPGAVTYNLKVLDIRPTRFSEFDTLRKLSIMCPFITKLETFIGSQEELEVCAQFRFLTQVHFCFRETCDLLPFLERRGRGLMSMTITCSSSQVVMWFNCYALVQLCPSLEYLMLRRMKFEKMIPYSERNLKNTLHYLRELHIIDADHENLEQSVIFILSQSPNLKSFTFKNDPPFRSPTFVDSFLECKCISSCVELDLARVCINVAKLEEVMYYMSFLVYKIIPVSLVLIDGDLLTDEFEGSVDIFDMPAVG